MLGPRLRTLPLLLQRHLLPDGQLAQLHAKNGSQLLLGQDKDSLKQPAVVPENWNEEIKEASARCSREGGPRPGTCLAP